MEVSLRVAILGPGGVGGLLAALLAGAGHEVVCLARPATASALREYGIRLTSARFGDRAQPVSAAEELTQPVDICLVTVKATQLAAALDRVPAQALGGALLVPLLNGFEHMATLRARYPQAVVAAGAMRVESTLTGPGQVQHSSPFASLELAEAPGVERLAAALEQAGLDVKVRANEVNVLWDKLGFLAPLALLTTVTAEPAGVVRGRERSDLVAIVTEIAAVARAEGAAGDVQAVLSAFDSLPPAMRSSMQRDAEQGRPLEVDALGGAVLRAAAGHQLDVPVTARLVAELQSRSRASS